MDHAPTADRRTFLKLGAGASAASLSALAGCSNLHITFEPKSGARPATRFVLGAKAKSFRGIAPEYIRKERNPTLHMRPGKTVDLVVKNIGGGTHALVVENSLDRTLLETEPTTRRGQTRTLTFEASQEMTTYLDPHHPVLMRGELLVNQY